MPTAAGQTLTHLGDMPIEEFLKDYWQKKPLLIRNAFPNLPKIEADVLAGYSLDEDIESRILIETPIAGQPLSSQWQMLCGPQHEDIFSELPSTHWTLLVQAVDQLDPQMHELLNQFRFIPNWRVDDIMVSYASQYGNVGPHFDYYDVFLVQAQGERLWKLGPRCNASSKLRTDTDCKVLSQFETEHEWLVGPGDLLYIPPQVSHWGIAQNECVTYSVGFRAPSHSEILLDLSQELASLSNQDQRFSDQGLSPRENPGEIQNQDIEQVTAIMKRLLDDKEALALWFGKYMTQTKRDAPSFEPLLKSRLSASSRAAYFKTVNQANQCTLFVDGEHHSASVEFAQALCSYQTIEPKHFPSDRVLMDHLYSLDILT